MPRSCISTEEGDSISQTDDVSFPDLPSSLENIQDNAGDKNVTPEELESSG